MQLTSNKTPIVEKTEELCRTIVDQPSFAELGEKIKQFEGNEDVCRQYEALIAHQNRLQQKHEDGEQLSEEEIAHFEKEKETFFANPIAKDYMDAQQAMHKVVQTVHEYVTKTFELGRVPNEEDFSSGCGPNCKCSCG